MRVLVSDPVANDGVDYLRQYAEVDLKTGLKPEELIRIIPGYDALVVRSETKVTAEVIEAGTGLQVIGRAGVGIDNIDVAAATRRGIVVVNAPTGNNIAAAEHTIGMMLAVARNIPQAYLSLRAGNWQRSKFMGVELRDKLLGVAGLGKIGTEVARRAQGLEMQVIAYDPYLSAEHAKRLGIEAVTLDELLRRADFVTIHVPLTPQTRGLIGAEQLRRMKPTARLINCARGGVVDEAALLEALDSGIIAGAALDVFAHEPLPADSPLLRSDKVVVTPHLAGSTVEAQVGVALDVAEQIAAVLRGQSARYAVNAPVILPETMSVLGPYLELAGKLGSLVTQLSEGQLRSIEVTYAGEISEMETAPLKAMVIKGLLQPVLAEEINLVNAPVIAKSRGLNVVERKTGQVNNYSNLITIRLDTDRSSHVVAGTAMLGEPHLVRVDKYWVDVVLAGGTMLFSYHRDRPGMIGHVGTVLGKASVNISFMSVGRLAPKGESLMVIGVDDPVGPALVEKLLAVPDIHAIQAVKI
ncbi:MAG: phosphoglycerate dehydrogenase [Chloroflexota bacterium]